MAMAMASQKYWEYSTLLMLWRYMNERQLCLAMSQNVFDFPLQDKRSYKEKQESLACAQTI
jgi:hypothetical protein